MSQFSVANLSFSNPNLVTLEIGQPAELFSISGDFLASVSSHFQHIVEDAVTGSQHSVITINDTTPAVFRLFLDWLYFRRIPSGRYLDHLEGACHNCEGPCLTPVTNPAVKFEPITPNPNKAPAIQRYANRPGPVELYIFAHSYGIRSLCETIVEQGRAAGYLQGEIFTYQDTITVTRELSADCALHRLVVDSFATFWSPIAHMRCVTDRELFQKLLPELIYSSMSLLATKRDDPKFMENINGPCKYHDHDDTLRARDACKAKHEVQRKRKADELDRMNRVCKAIAESYGAARSPKLEFQRVLQISDLKREKVLFG